MIRFDEILAKYFPPGFVDRRKIVHPRIGAQAAYRKQIKKKIKNPSHDEMTPKPNIRRGPWQPVFIAIGAWWTSTKNGTATFLAGILLIGCSASSQEQGMVEKQAGSPKVAAQEKHRTVLPTVASPVAGEIKPKRIGTYMGGGLGLYGPMENWEHEIELVKDLNVGIIRFNSDIWDLLEPQRGVYQWDKLDHLVDLVTREGGMDILFTLPIASKWNGENKQVNMMGFPIGRTHFPTKDMESFRDFCQTLAARYKGRIKYYEAWNEPDFLMFWKGDMQPDAAEYLPFLKEAYKTIKETDPDAIILNGGLAKPQETLWLNKLLDLGGGSYFDIMNIHIYPAFARYPDALDVTEKILARHHLVKTIWVTETSTTGTFFETQNREKEEYDKSVYLVQNFTRALSRPDVGCIFWHSLKNPGKDIHLPKDYDFGLINSDGVLLPAYKAFQVWSRTLIGSNPLGRLGDGTNIEIYQFEHDGKMILVAWTNGDEQRLIIPEKYTKVRITTLRGDSKKIKRSKTPEIALGKEPVYLELLDE